jgi:hypothetical protein
MAALKLYTILKIIDEKYMRIYTEDSGNTLSGVPIHPKKVEAKRIPIRDMAPPQITAAGNAELRRHGRLGVIKQGVFNLDVHTSSAFLLNLHPV